MKQVFVWFPPERAPEPVKSPQWTWLRCVMVALALTNGAVKDERAERQGGERAAGA